MELPELLGSSVGIMIGNPLILIAGLVVSRTSPARARFWAELALAAIICTAIQFAFDKGISDLPSPLGVGESFVIVALGTIWATIIFLLLRMLKAAVTRREMKSYVEN